MDDLYMLGLSFQTGQQRIAEGNEWLRASSIRSEVYPLLFHIRCCLVCHIGALAFTDDNGQRIAVREGGELHYLYGDHLGSTSVTLNAAGQVVAQRRYEAYGQKRWWRGVEQTDFGFNSQREESEFGLYDYKARYFSPLLGRFISADTIVPNYANPQSLNRYAYVYNNPLRYTAPYRSLFS